MMIYKLFVSSSIDSYYNLAKEEWLFKNKKKGETIVFLWQNDKTVVIGRYQNIYDEVNILFAKENDIKIVRRITGGGAVYHDLGNLNYSFITDQDNSDLESCKAMLINVLEGIGISAIFKGRNDIIADGSKISGTAEHIRDGKILHHGTLLVNSNLDVLKTVLTRKNKVTNSPAQKSTPHRVTNINILLNTPIDVFDVISLIKRKLNVNVSDLPNGGEKEIEDMVNGKYKTLSWNYGFQPEYSFANTKRFSGGVLSVNVKINSGVIEDVVLTGDFIGLKDIHDLEVLMRNMRLDNRFLTQLHEIRAGDYIKDISCDDINELFMETLPVTYG